MSTDNGRYVDSGKLLRLSKSVLVNRLLDCGLELEDALERIVELEEDLLDADWEREQAAIVMVDRFGLDDSRVGTLISVLDRVTDVTVTGPVGFTPTDRVTFDA